MYVKSPPLGMFSGIKMRGKADKRSNLVAILSPDVFLNRQLANTLGSVDQKFSVQVKTQVVYRPAASTSQRNLGNVKIQPTLQTPSESESAF